MLWVNNGALAAQLVALWQPTEGSSQQSGPMEQVDDVWQRATVVEAGLATAQLLTGDPSTPLFTAIRALRALKGIVVAAKPQPSCVNLQTCDEHVVSETMKGSTKAAADLEETSDAECDLEATSADGRVVQQRWQQQTMNKQQQVTLEHYCFRPKLGPAQWPEQTVRRPPRIQLSSASTVGTETHCLLADGQAGAQDDALCEEKAEAEEAEQAELHLGCVAGETCLLDGGEQDYSVVARGMGGNDAGIAKAEVCAAGVLSTAAKKIGGVVAKRYTWRN